MRPELIGLLIGVAFIVPTIYVIRARDWDSIAWPAFLITLPVYYMLFGVLALDWQVVLLELLYGLPFVAAGLMAWRIRSRLTLVVVAIGWFAHGFYDFYHDLWFVNPGVFSWYPAFCAFVDVAVASYLVLSASRLTTART